MPTLREIAQAAGVSAATVSMVIHGDLRVSQQTRQLVEQTITAMGYEPRQAGRPRRNRDGAHLPKSFVFLTNHTFTQFKRALMYLDVLDGIHACLGEIQASTQFVHGAPDAPLPDEVTRATTQGIIVLGPELVPRLLALKPAVPFVHVMGAPMFNEQWDHVTCNNQLVAELAAQYLLKLGHRHIALLKIDNDNPPYTQRNAAFEQYALAHGAKVRVNDNLPFSNFKLMHDPIARILQTLFKGPHRPTAFYTAADMFAVAAYPMLHGMGLRPGRDVIMASGNRETNTFTGMEHHPASVDLHPFEIGYQSARTLLRRLSAPRVPCSLQLVCPSLPELDALTN